MNNLWHGRDWAWRLDWMTFEKSGFFVVGFMSRHTHVTLANGPKSTSFMSKMGPESEVFVAGLQQPNLA